MCPTDGETGRVDVLGRYRYALPVHRLLLLSVERSKCTLELTLGLVGSSLFVAARSPLSHMSQHMIAGYRENTCYLRICIYKLHFLIWSSVFLPARE
jgi:hypothetical protein